MEKNIEAILFDLDGTILSYEDCGPEYWADIYIDVAKILGLEPPEYKELVEMTRKRELRKLFLIDKGITKEEYYKIFDEVFPKHVIKGLNESKIRFYHDTEEMLSELSKKYKLGIVTNHSKIGVEAITEKLGLKRFFQVITYFGIEGLKEKPSPDMIFYTMEKLNAKKCLMVGDSQDDVDAVNNANKIIKQNKLDFMLIEREKVRIENYKPKIYSLYELEKILNR